MEIIIETKNTSNLLNVYRETVPGWQTDRQMERQTNVHSNFVFWQVCRVFESTQQFYKKISYFFPNIHSYEGHLESTYRGILSQ